MSSEPLWNRRTKKSFISELSCKRKILKFSRVNIKIAKRCKIWWLTLNILLPMWLTVLHSPIVSQFFFFFQKKSFHNDVSHGSVYLLLCSVHLKRMKKKSWETNNQKSLNDKMLRDELAAHSYKRSTTLLLLKQRTADLLYLGYGYKYGKWTFFYFSRFEVVDKFRFNWVSSR